MASPQDTSPSESNNASLRSSGNHEVVPHHHRKRHHSRWYKRLVKRTGLHVRWARLILVLVAFIVVVTVGVLALIFDSVNQVQLSIASFQRVMASVSARPGTELTLDDFDRLDSSVSDLVGSLATAQSRLRIMHPFVFVNHQVATTVYAVDAAVDLAQAAQYVLNGLQPTLQFMVSGSSSQTIVTQISSGEQVVDLLQVGKGQFANAGTLLEQAAQIVSSLDLTGVNPTLALQLDSLGKYTDQLKQINGVLISAPDFLNDALGLSGQHNYLVLSQNNDELRPSGGYISTYGWMSVRNGQITDYSYSATTTTSPNPPAASLVSQLNMPSWWLHYQQPIYAAWDGSWYADFPSTAKMSIWYYNTGNNPQSPVDGAIAIDINGFEDLLKVIGSVTVPGYENSPVTADNFRQVIYDIRDFGGGDEPHKKFLAALYRQIFTEWENISADPTKDTTLLGVLLQALQQKHIMLYFTDPELEQAVNLAGWSGAQGLATDNDYSMVVDANLGNKSNHSIFRSLSYDVDVQDDGSVKGKATLSYDYSARTAASDPGVHPPENGLADYNNLLQFFVPAGTTLITATNTQNTPTTVNNPTNTEFVTQLYLPFDSTQNYEFAYTTKPIVQSLGAYKRYRLLLQKQPGTDADAVNLQISLPVDSTFISSTPIADGSYNLDRPVLEFRTDLSVDRWIEVIYK